MLILLTGASGAGKSTYALKLAKQLSKNRVFISTEFNESDIKADSEKLHGDGFVFIERFTNIGGLDISGGVAVLDCLCNLTANEMFNESGQIRENAAGNVINGILDLSAYFKFFIAVTNEISSDGVVYEASTAAYRDALCAINRELAEAADCVIELCTSFPIILKGNLTKDICGDMLSE